MSEVPVRPEIESLLTSLGLKGQSIRREELQGPLFEILRSAMDAAQGFDPVVYEAWVRDEESEGYPISFARDLVARYATGSGAEKLLGAEEEYGVPALALLVHATRSSMLTETPGLVDRTEVAGLAAFTRQLAIELMMGHRPFAVNLLKDARVDPKEWRIVEDLIEAIQAYGTTDDTLTIPALEKVYGQAHQLLPGSVRAELASVIADQVDLGRLSINALMPFLFHEACQSVVSTAALRFAVVATREDDPLSGVRYLVEQGRLAAAPNCLVDIVSGLLLLGDRRIIDHLGQCWRWFDADQRRRLSEMRSDFLHAALIDWHIDWLEDCEGEEFGLVAGSLARMGIEARTKPVGETRRALPVTSVPLDQAIENLEIWWYPAFGRRIEPRLRILERLETAPCVMPDVIREWGLG